MNSVCTPLNFLEMTLQSGALGGGVSEQNNGNERISFKKCYAFFNPCSKCFIIASLTFVALIFILLENCGKEGFCIIKHACWLDNY